MGSYKEEREVGYSKFGKIVKTCIACLVSFLVSMFGGLMLVWWDLEYRPTNSKLWMVPFGLILMVTPLIVWFSAFISDICSPEDSDLNHPVNNIVR